MLPRGDEPRAPLNPNGGPPVVRKRFWHWKCVRIGCVLAVPSLLAGAGVVTWHFLLDGTPHPPVPEGFALRRVIDEQHPKANEYLVTFDLPFDNTTVFRRRFKAILPSAYPERAPTFVIVDSHGYNTPDFADQHKFSGFYGTVVEQLNAIVVTTWGSADTYSDLAGWNAWGCASAVLDPQALDFRPAYPCVRLAMRLRKGRRIETRLGRGREYATDVGQLHRPH